MGNTFWRITLIYITSLTIIGLNLPYNQETLLGGSDGAGTSPFVIMANLAGLNGHDHLHLCPIDRPVVRLRGLARPDGHGRDGLCAQDLHLRRQVGSPGLSTLFTWGSICMCHIRFRKAWRVQGHHLDELPYKAIGGVYGSWCGFILVCLVLVANFYIAVWPLGGGSDDPAERAEQFFLAYLAAPVLLAFWLGCFLIKRTLPYKAHEIDLDTGRKAWFTAEEMNQYRAERRAAPWHIRMYRILFSA